jgi:hypothetical protein
VETFSGWVVDAIPMVVAIGRENNKRAIRTALLLRIFSPPGKRGKVETFRANYESAGPSGHDPS